MSEPTLDERIARGAPPETAGQIDAALAPRDGKDAIRYAKWALAHRARFGTETSTHVEEAVSRLVATGHRGALVELAGAIHAYWPSGFLEARVRGVTQLALELDVLAPRDLFLLLNSLLADDARFDAFARHAERRALGARIRVAALARSIALASTFVGSLDALLGEERSDAFARVIEGLYRDRDPAVGARAAWAAGALVSRSSRLERLALGGAQRGLLARRAMVARTARWLLGEESDATYLDELRKGAGRSDVFVRGAAIQAMQLGARLAPETCADVVESLVDGAAPEVLAAAGAFAYALDDEARRESLLGRLRAEAARPGRELDVSVRFWIGPRAAPADAIVRALGDLRAASRESADAARDTSGALLAHVQAAIAAPADDAIDHAVDLALLDTTILRDALVASAATDDERASRYRAWAATLDALAPSRVARFAAADAEDASVARDRLRRMGRVLDAHPRRDAAAPRAGDGPPSSAIATFLGACDAATRALLDRAARCEPQLERPIAVALAPALEPLLAHGRIAATDVLGTLLRTESASFARHLAASLAAPDLASALAALVSLRAAIDGATATTPRKATGDAFPRVRDETKRFCDAAELLDRSSPLGVAARALREAVSGLARASRGDGGLTLVSLFREALDALAAAQRTTSLDAAPSSVPAQSERALYSLFAAEKLVAAEDSDRPFGANRIAAILAKSLPPALAGLIDALVAEARADARLRADAAVPPAASSRPGVIGPGWRIADYVVEAALGSGGMGHCVLVRRRLEQDQKNARRWVLKIPQTAEHVAAFRNEALAMLFLSKTNHPAIVRFVSYVDYGYRLPFLVMEYVDGEPLDRRLARGPLPLADVFAIGARLADGIATSHAMSVCHHDIKPGNIVLAKTQSGVRAVLVDWGLAGAAYPWAGTPEYMAPERFDFSRSGASAASAAGHGAPASSDVFALGCVLAEMASGKRLVCEPLTAEDTGEESLALKGYGLLDPQFRRNYACEALVKNPPFLERRLERALALMASVGGEEAASGAVARRFAELLRAMLQVRADARPTAASVAERLGSLGG